MQFPYAEVEFDRDGALVDPAQVTAAADLLRTSQATDVLVLAHGWNNDLPRARNLYRALTDSMAAVRDDVPGAAGRAVAVVGVLWPSMRWADEDDISGGAASTSGLPGQVSPAEPSLAGRIEEVVADRATADRLKALVPELETSADARSAFLSALRGLLPALVDDPRLADDGLLADDSEQPPLALVAGDAEDAFAAAGGPDTSLLEAPVVAQPGGGRGRRVQPVGAGGAAVVGPGGGFGAGSPAGSAVGLFFERARFLVAARNLLNVTTFYTMKERAGTVGTAGVARLLDALAAAAPQVRRHLAGHSFGARVVSAAATRHRPIHSITLLQAAFSHHGFGRDFRGGSSRGAFRAVLDPGPLAGPLVVTHTANDRAVGLAYALASRLARQSGAGVGGPDDLYGGLGCNGALKTPEAVHPPAELQDVGSAYRFFAGKVHNLKADRFVRGHSDVTSRQVAHALLWAMTTTT
jgi:hypothetical protein